MATVAIGKVMEVLSALTHGFVLLEAETVEAEPVPTPDEADTIRLCPAPAPAACLPWVPFWFPYFLALWASCIRRFPIKFCSAPNLFLSVPFFWFPAQFALFLWTHFWPLLRPISDGFAKTIF